MISTHAATLTLTLPDETTTTRLGQAFARVLGSGDALLLSGPIGAGKSHLARAIILAKLATEGRIEDVPSPTYTLVQTYETIGGEIWHTDLYRLGDAGEVLELGLDDAFETALCLVEWPDRLGSLAPTDALDITLMPDGAGRRATLRAEDPKWSQIVAELKRNFA